MMLTSPQNPRIKSVIKLRRRRGRDRLGLMLIEGTREVSRALSSGVEMVEVFVCPSLASGEDELKLLREMEKRGISPVEISGEVLEKIAYREDSSSIVAVAKQAEKSLDMLPYVDDPLYLVVDAVEKPGNLGAILRTADAVGATGLIVSDPATDLFNPNVIRSSLGTVFTVPSAVTDASTAARWLSERNIAIITSSPDAVTSYTAVDMTGASAVVVGSEEAGAGSTWFEHSDFDVRIPMMGVADSLNVSAAAAVLMYEAMRQRSVGEREPGPELPPEESGVHANLQDE